MQSLLFPEFSPSDLDNAALSEWTDRWLAGFPELDRENAGLAEHSLALRKIMTPLGPMVAATAAAGLVLLEFVERERIADQLARATKLHGGPLFRLAPSVEPSPAGPADSVSDCAREMCAVEDQVDAYFAGERESFDLRLAPTGTPFQRAVWAELSRIPFGAQASYGEIASAVGRPSASRAVGAANGRNPIAIVIPCHRVVGSDGTLTGYAGGLWRKRRLLELEAQTLLAD